MRNEVANRALMCDGCIRMHFTVPRAPPANPAVLLPHRDIHLHLTNPLVQRHSTATTPTRLPRLEPPARLVSLLPLVVAIYGLRDFVISRGETTCSEARGRPSRACCWWVRGWVGHASVGVWRRVGRADRRGECWTWIGAGAGVREEEGSSGREERKMQKASRKKLRPPPLPRKQASKLSARSSRSSHSVLCFPSAVLRKTI